MQNKIIFVWIFENKWNMIMFNKIWTNIHIRYGGWDEWK